MMKVNPGSLYKRTFTACPAAGLILLMLAAVFILSETPHVSAQKAPGTAVPKTPDTRPDASSLSELLATDSGIDSEIARINNSLAKLRAEISAAGSAPAPLVTAQASGEVLKESADRERIRSELLIDLEKQIDTLNELKEIRKDNSSYELEQQSWRGFAEKPPFPIEFIDDIRDSLLSQRLALESSEMWLSLANTSWKRYNDEVIKSRKELRRAEEAAARGTGTKKDQPGRLSVEFAKLRNDRNEAGLILAELQRITYETAVQGKRRKIGFLREKLRAAAASSPFSREDLEKKLRDLDGQRQHLEAELAAAQKAEADGRKKLDDLRSALNRLTAPVLEKQQEPGLLRKIFGGQSSNKKKDAAQKDAVLSLRADMEAQQAFLETARLNVTVLRTRIELINAAERTWHDRFWLGSGTRDLNDLRKKKEEGKETLVRLNFVKKWADSSLSSWMNLIRNQKERLSSEARGATSARTQALILASYEERQNITLRLIESLGGLDRLVIRANDELDRRIRGASFSAQVKEQFQNGYSFLASIWNSELYVAAEATIVEGRAIDKPVSVTIGKVIKALILLIAGTWLAAKIGNILKWFLTKRLSWTAGNAEPLGKLIFGVMFISVFVISLISVNIPLAVFTFLGGALAIGLGFGAQNIINNFISGMILLFDRSIKVGDIVEVDGQGGRVISIGMRNSHIKRFDGIDMLVPNSQFLQQKVTNWTLSDRRMRYSVTIGVSYGSPTREVEKIILATIETHPMVLKEPPPVILFEEFGSSSLSFTGYFWLEMLSNRDNRIAVSQIRHELGTALEKAGITISFPQQDVHIDSSRPIEVRVLPPDTEGGTDRPASL